MRSEKRKYDFDGIWTPDLFRSFIPDKTLSYSVSADCDLKRGPLLFIIKDGSPTLKPSQFRPPTQKQVNFDAHSNTKRFAARIQNHVNFDHLHKIKSIDHHPKNNSISAHTQSISPHNNQVNSDPYTEIKSISTTHTTTKSMSSTLKLSQVPSLTLKPSQLPPPTQKPSQFRYLH